MNLRSPVRTFTFWVLNGEIMRILLIFVCMSCVGATLHSAASVQLITGGITNATAGGNSFAQSITPDGRYVVFVSHANNLVTNDDFRPHGDIFVRDVTMGITSLVSGNTNGSGGGDGNSGYASITSNGRYVVFSSAAGNLVSYDTNGISDVFRRDLRSGTTELISVPIRVPGLISMRGPTVGASKPVITANGRWIAFDSASVDLVVGDTNQTRKIFVRDMNHGVTLLASVGAYRSFSPSLSANGRRVAFISHAADVMPGRTNVLGDVFVRDLRESITHWVSANAATVLQTTGPYKCYNPAIAPDGSFVVFKAAPASSLASAYVLHHDVSSGITTVIASNTHPNTEVSLSADNRWIAFEEDGGVYMRDLRHGTNLLVSVNAGGTGAVDGLSHGPVMTPDARYVAFVSSTSNLTADPPPGTNAYRMYLRDVVLGVTKLVTRDIDGSPVSVGETTAPLISADGQVVAFDTDTSTLLPDDNNGAYDVFLHKVPAGTTELLSVPHSDRLSTTASQSAGISKHSVSANALRIAFVSGDHPRFPEDTNGYPDVFVLDRVAGTIIPQSTTTNDSFAVTNRAFHPLISADGNYVIFATQPAPTPGHSSPDFYPGEKSLLWWRAVSGGPAKLLNSGYVSPSAIALSSNGNLVAYPKDGRLFLADMVRGTGKQWFFSNVRNVAFSPDENWIIIREPGRLYALSVSSTNVILLSTNAVGGAVFSDSGRYFVYEGAPRAVYRYDFVSNSTQLICTNCFQPGIDATGSLIAMREERPGPVSPSGFSTFEYNIYLINLGAGTTNLVSVNFSGNGRGSGPSKTPVLTGDGRYLVFLSSASDLVLGDDNQAQDVFVHDTLQKTTMLVSRNHKGLGSASGRSANAVLARDGRTVVFQSFAGDVVTKDYNEQSDIFLLKLGVGDSDNDGMDDDWEVAHFDNLSRDGAGDLDGDGQTDRQEFVSGTNPTNNGSVLRVLTVSPMGGGSTTVIWAAVPGRSYVVQFKDSLNAANWSNASGVLTASSSSETFVHPSSAAQRYYRVITVQ